MKALATLSKTRTSSLPELATAQEQGLAGFDASGWYALSLPAGTPAEIIQELNRALIAILQTPRISLDDAESLFRRALAIREKEPA